MTNIASLHINKSNFADCEIHEAVLDKLTDGEVLLQVDKFALTSNNITYAVAGNRIGYWNFFPVKDDMGIVPVWGFATVVESQHADIQVGERFYGFYPMASHLKVAPVKHSDFGFIDGAEHRRTLPIIYNYYTNTAHDNVYSVETENLQCLLRPLFTTSFLIDHFFADNDFFNSQQIILTSASSKTALALAHLIDQRKEQQSNTPKLIGLTSAKNKAFVVASGYYDEVFIYENYNKIEVVNGSIVEFAGRHKLQYQLQTHLNELLQHNCLVGIVDWKNIRGEEKLPKRGDFFFAPTVAQEKQKEWGRAEFGTKLENAWKGFVPAAADWLNVKENTGMVALQEIYLKMLEGDFDAKDGFIVTRASSSV